MSVCSRNPYDELCRAKYGGPVLPAVALGGFPAPDQYFNASALILTILVNNKHDKEKVA